MPDSLSDIWASAVAETEPPSKSDSLSDIWRSAVTETADSPAEETLTLDDSEDDVSPLDRALANVSKPKAAAPRRVDNAAQRALGSYSEVPVLGPVASGLAHPLDTFTGMVHPSQSRDLRFDPTRKDEHTPVMGDDGKPMIDPRTGQVRTVPTSFESRHPYLTGALETAKGVPFVKNYAAGIKDPQEGTLAGTTKEALAGLGEFVLGAGAIKSASSAPGMFQGVTKALEAAPLVKSIALATGIGAEHAGLNPKDAAKNALVGGVMHGVGTQIEPFVQNAKSIPGAVARMAAANTAAGAVGVAADVGFDYMASPERLTEWKSIVEKQRTGQPLTPEERSFLADFAVSQAVNVIGPTMHGTYSAAAGRAKARADADTSADYAAKQRLLVEEGAAQTEQAPPPLNQPLPAVPSGEAQADVAALQAAKVAPLPPLPDISPADYAKNKVPKGAEDYVDFTLRGGKADKEAEQAALQDAFTRETGIEPGDKAIPLPDTLPPAPVEPEAASPKSRRGGKKAAAVPVQAETPADVTVPPTEPTLAPVEAPAQLVGNPAAKTIGTPKDEATRAKWLAAHEAALAKNPADQEAANNVAFLRSLAPSPEVSAKEAASNVEQAKGNDLGLPEASKGSGVGEEVVPPTPAEAPPVAPQPVSGAEPSQPTAKPAAPVESPAPVSRETIAPDVQPSSAPLGPTLADPVKVKGYLDRLVRHVTGEKADPNLETHALSPEEFGDMLHGLGQDPTVPRSGIFAAKGPAEARKRVIAINTAAQDPNGAVVHEVFHHAWDKIVDAKDKAGLLFEAQRKATLDKLKNFFSTQKFPTADPNVAETLPKDVQDTLNQMVKDSPTEALAWMAQAKAAGNYSFGKWADNRFGRIGGFLKDLGEYVRGHGTRLAEWTKGRGYLTPGDRMDLLLSGDYGAGPVGRTGARAQTVRWGNRAASLAEKAHQIGGIKEAFRTFDPNDVTGSIGNIATATSSKVLQGLLPRTVTQGHGIAYQENIRSGRNELSRMKQQRAIVGPIFDKYADNPTVLDLMHKAANGMTDKSAQADAFRQLQPEAQKDVARARTIIDVGSKVMDGLATSEDAVRYAMAEPALDDLTPKQRESLAAELLKTVGTETKADRPESLDFVKPELWDSLAKMTDDIAQYPLVDRDPAEAARFAKGIATSPEMRETFAKNLGSYVTRAYEIDSIRGAATQRWKDYQAYREGVNSGKSPAGQSDLQSKNPKGRDVNAYIEERMANDGLKRNEAEALVRDEFFSRAGADQPLSVRGSASAGDGTQTKILKARTNPSDKARAALGEITHPAASLSQTAFLQNAIASKHLMFKQMADMMDPRGNPMFADERSTRNSVQLGQVKNAKGEVEPELDPRYGALTGKWTTPEGAEVVNNWSGGAGVSGFEQMLRPVTSFFQEAKTTLSPSAQGSQLIGNMSFLSAFNGVSPLNPFNAKYWQKAANVVREVNRADTAKTPPSADFQEFMQQGAGGAAKGFHDKGALARTADMIEAAMRKGGPQNWWTSFDKIMRGQRSFRDKSAAFWQSVDQMVRAATYFKYRDKGLSPEQASRETNDGNMNYSATGPWVKRFGKSPLASGFLAFQAEMPRITANFVRKRPVAAAAMAAAIGALAKGAVTLSPEDREKWQKADILTGRFQRGGYNVPFRNPATGKLYFVNLGRYFPFAPYLMALQTGGKSVTGESPVAGNVETTLNSGFDPGSVFLGTPVPQTLATLVQGSDTQGNRYADKNAPFFPDKTIGAAKKLGEMVGPGPLITDLPRIQKAFAGEATNKGEIPEVGPSIARSVGIGIMRINPDAAYNRATMEMEDRFRSLYNDKVRRPLENRDPARRTPEVIAKAQQNAMALLQALDKEERQLNEAYIAAVELDPSAQTPDMRQRRKNVEDARQAIKRLKTSLRKP